jgi:FkbM family methyltransferase
MPQKKEIFLSYSSCFEDLILYHLTKNTGADFYIDIGANDPIRESVTKHFYLNGWTGINIDPLPDKYQALVDDRPKDINLNIGIADKEGELKFYIRDGLTTCAAETIKHIPNKDKVPTIIVPVLPLKDITAKYVKSKIGFLKIDVEGFELNVLNSADFNGARPLVICIESTIAETRIPAHQKWEPVLTENDYLFCMACDVNRYYIDKRCADFETLLHNAQNADSFENYDIFVHTPFRQTAPRSTWEKIKHYSKHLRRFARYYLPF